MNVTEQMKITQGDRYVKHGHRVARRDGERVVEDVDLGEATVQGFVLDDRTGHELVAYVMAEGNGRTRVCSLDAFAVRFRPLAQLGPAAGEAPTEPPGRAAEAPGKVAGYLTQGNPW